MDTSYVRSVSTSVLHWLVDLGVARAPLEMREQIRKMNRKVLFDSLFGQIFTIVYVAIGAWKLLGLSLGLSFLGIGVLILNAFGFFTAARSLVATSFAIAAAVVNFALGPGMGVELFVFAGIASIYANFAQSEKREIRAALFITFVLTVGSFYFSQGRQPWIEVPVHYVPYLKGMVWFISAALLISQIKIFLDSAEQARVRIEKSERLQSAIFNQAGTGLALVMPNGTLVNTNPSLNLLLGYGDNSLEGRNILDLTVQEDRARSRTDVDQLISGVVDVVTFDKRYIHRDGHTMPCSTQVKVLRDVDGSALFMIASIQDLTALKSSEQKMIQASKMSSLGEMAGSIAHEINTPLAVIQLCAEQIKTADAAALPAGESARHASMIMDTVQRVAQIVKGLKAFSRNAHEEPKQIRSMKEIVEETLLLCADGLKSKGIEVSISLPQDVSLNCHPSQISQVLFNLLANAADAASARVSGQRSIQIESRLANSKVELRITDSGAGVSPAVVDRIFEPFFTTKPFGAGTGLGLSIAKGLMETNGGRVFLDSSRAQTCFVMCFGSEAIVAGPTTQKRREIAAS